MQNSASNQMNAGCSNDHERRENCVDPTATMLSRVVDLDELSVAADGLIRLREDEPNDRQRSRQSSSAARFPHESLHSFRFSSANRNGLAELRKSLMNRSITFMKECNMRPWKSPDTLPGHFTASSLLTGDTLGRSKTKSVGYSPVTAFNVEDYRANRRRRRSNPMPDIQETQPDEATKRRPITPLTPDELGTIPEQGTSSRTSTTSVSSSSAKSLDIPEDDDDEECQPSSSNFVFPHPALHHPSRFLPQNQAILTTYNDWRVILSNDIAAMVLVGAGGSCRGLVGKSVVDFIEPSYRSRFLDMVTRRREELSHLEDSSGGMVLVCGNVLPIVKQDGTKSAASLWLKEKRNDSGSSVYIWIFEEVFETVVHVSVDIEGTMLYVDEAVHELYGYEPNELIGKSVNILIPSLKPGKDKKTLQDINRLRFFGSKTKLGACFPIIAKVHTVSKKQDSGSTAPCFTIRITSIPMIAGLVTIRRDGSIEGCNAVFTRYMFGLSQEELVSNHTDIAKLMPQLPTLLKCLQRDDLLQHGIIINNLICRKLIADMDIKDNELLSSLWEKYQGRRLTRTPNGQSLPVLIAIHRDGTPFEVQLQLKLVDGSDDVYALWITFDREATFSRFGHPTPVCPPLEIKQHDGLGLPAAKRPALLDSPHNDEDDEEEEPNEDESTPEESPKEEKEEEEEKKETRPMRIATSFSRPNVYGSLASTPGSPVSPSSFRSKSSVAQASSSSDSSPPSKADPDPYMPEYSAQTNATTIDDYIILDNLGQGAYGLVKLAVRKDDPEQKKVVIKYVIKSRILVDCWTKDRKLGVIPVEIHILHTLRKIPHQNCSDMLDYFEDEDHYYIVMGLHGVGMDLFDYIELKNGMTDREIQSIFKQIAEAVRHLHDHKIVHRDIKDENVVLDQSGGVRLIDFGSAAYLKGRRYDTFVGTLDYAAPEILAGQTYEGPPQDIWALGILLYTLVYRENPFYDIDEILSRELRVPFVLSEGSLDLIKKMLVRNVDERPNIHEVLAHPWLNS